MNLSLVGQFQSVVSPTIQWEFQDPKMEVLYHTRPYFAGLFPYIGLKNMLDISLGTINRFLLHGDWTIDWLVVWSMNFMVFHSVGNVIIPSDFVIFFRGVGLNHQPWRRSAEAWEAKGGGCLGFGLQELSRSSSGADFGERPVVI